MNSASFLTSFFCQANVKLLVCDIILTDQYCTVLCDTIYFCVATLIWHLAGPWRERNYYIYVARSCAQKEKNKMQEWSKAEENELETCQGYKD